MPKSNGPSMNCGFTRVATLPSLNRITPAAPASSAFASFSTNGQVPRWISAILPAVVAGKSLIWQPLVDVLFAPEWMTMSFVGTTSRFVSVPDWANPNVIMSTAVSDADDGEDVKVLVPQVSRAGV